MRHPPFESRHQAGASPVAATTCARTLALQLTRKGGAEPLLSESAVYRCLVRAGVIGLARRVSSTFASHTADTPYERKAELNPSWPGSVA